MKSIIIAVFALFTFAATSNSQIIFGDITNPQFKIGDVKIGFRTLTITNNTPYVLIPTYDGDEQEAVATGESFTVKVTIYGETAVTNVTVKGYDEVGNFHGMASKTFKFSWKNYDAKEWVVNKVR